MIGTFAASELNSSIERFRDGRARKEPWPKNRSRTQSDVKRAMHKRKEGTLKSGRSGKTVKSKRQAIAIGLSEARAKGKKVSAKKAS